MGIWSQKILSPTYWMDGSSRIPMGALLQKVPKSYLRGGRIPNDIDKYLSSKTLLSPTSGWIDPDRYLGSKNITKSYLRVDGYLRISTGTLVQKIISLTYGVDGLPRTPMGVLVRKY